MTKNAPGNGRLAKGRAGRNRFALSATRWEFSNPSRDNSRNQDYRISNRRTRQFRSNLTEVTLIQETRRRKSGLAALRDIGSGMRLDTEALLESVHFNEGSVEDCVAMGLTGSMSQAEANLVAIELGRLINSAVYKHGLTIEERAINGEIGRRLAEYFALTYFEDKDQAKALMVLVDAFIERNGLLEKGYYFWDGQAYEAYKPVPISIIYKLGDVHWSKETAEAFRCNEQIVEETIKNAVATVNDDVVSDKLAQIMGKLGIIKDTVNEDDVLRDIQWVLDLQHLFLS